MKNRVIELSKPHKYEYPDTTDRDIVSGHFTYIFYEEEFTFEASYRCIYKINDELAIPDGKETYHYVRQVIKRSSIFSNELFISVDNNLWGVKMYLRDDYLISYFKEKKLATDFYEIMSTYAGFKHY